MNVPHLPRERIAGVEVTRLGKRNYRDQLVERLDPYGNPYYWVGGPAVADFAEPGWAKIACSVSVHPHGEGRSLLTYECRTTGTDAAAARGFKRYWRIVAPGVRLVFWRSAVAIRRRAEATL